MSEQDLNKELVVKITTASPPRAKSLMTFRYQTSLLA